MEEVLQVQNEINSIQEEMEAAATRVEYLTHQSSFSTISLNFYQPAKDFIPTSANPSFLTRLSNAFTSGASWLIELLVAIIAIWPIWLMTGTAVIVYKKTKNLKPGLQKR